MNRYFFNLRECGQVVVDEEGVDRHDLAAARVEALAAARSIMCAEVAEGRLCLSCSIEVFDASGTKVLTIPFRDALAISGL